MSIIDQYVKEVEKDLVIDEFNIKEASMKAPGKKHFWVSKLINHKRILMAYKSEKNDLKKDIIKEVMAQAPIKLTFPVAERTAEQHEKIKEVQSKIEEQELIVEFLEKVEKTFSSLSFDIKNIVEIMKMESL